MLDRGIQQYVEIRHPDAANWLACLKSERQPEAALWNSTPHRFRSMFKSVCRSLNIESLRLSPASLRAGGATWLVDQGIEVSRVRFLGRWAHMRSLEHYIQVARAQSPTNHPLNRAHHCPAVEEVPHAISFLGTPACFSG